MPVIEIWGILEIWHCKYNQYFHYAVNPWNNKREIDRIYLRCIIFPRFHVL